MELQDFKQPLLKPSSSENPGQVNMDSLIKELRSFDPFENKVFRGHSGAVWACAMTSDNKTIFSGSEDKTVCVWDASTQELLHTFEGHTGTVNGLSIVNDDKYLVSGDWDGKIFVWDWKNYTKVCDLVGHTAGVYCFVTSKCGKFLVSGSGDYTAKIWDLENFTLLGSCDCQGNSVFSAAIKSDFTEVVCGGWGGVIRVFSTENYEQKTSWDPKAGVIQSMGLTSNNKFLIIGTRNNLVKVFNYADQTEYCSFNSNENWVRNLVITNDDNYFITVSADKSIRIFNIKKKLEELSLEGSEGYVFGEYLSKDGQFLLTGASDKLMRLWKIGKPERVKNLVGHSKTIMSLEVTSDNKYVVTGSEDKTVRIWSLDSFTELSQLTAHSETVWSVSVTRDNKYIASASGDKKVIIWNFSERSIYCELIKHTNPVFCVTFSQDGKFAVSGAQDKNLVVWSISDKKDLATLDGHTDTVFAVKVTYDDKFIISGAADYTIRIWDVKTLKQVNKFETKAGMIESISLSPNGQFLVFGDRASKVNLWDWESKSLIKKFANHTKWVKSVNFSTDNTLFASASNDFDIRVWNAVEERQEFLLQEHTSTIRAVRFLPNNKYIVSAGEDLKIKVWNIDPENLELQDIGGALDTFVYLSKLKKKEKPSLEQSLGTFSKLRVNLVHIYSYLGYDDLLKITLELGAPIKVDKHGHSPLHYALQRNSQNCVDRLLIYLTDIKDKNIDLFLNYTSALRSDFEDLLMNPSVYLPDFLDAVFYTVPNLPNFAVPKGNLPELRYSDSKKINTSMFINNEGGEGDVNEIPIEFKTLPFSIPSNSGSYASLNFLQSIVDCRNKLVFQSKVIKSYVRTKWNNLWIFILMLTALMWSNLGLMIYCIVQLETISYTAVNIGDMALFLELFLFVNILLALYEFIQALSTGVAYIYSMWNIIDILRSTLCILWGVLCFEYSQGDLFPITWTMVVLNSFRGLTGFRAFDTTRFYTKLIFRAFNDSISFILIFFYSTFSFGVLHFVSMEGAEKDIFTLWKSPYQLNMGDTGDANGDSMIVYIYFMIASVINVIIMLNLLISILGDAFDSFQMEAAQIDVMEMADLVLEIEFLMFWKRNKNEKMFMQVCQDAENEASQEWEGRIRAVLNLIKSSNAKSEKEFERLNTKMDLVLKAVQK